MKLHEIWMFALTLPLMTPALGCSGDEEDDDAADEAGDGDGPSDPDDGESASGNGSGGGSGGSGAEPGDDDDDFDDDFDDDDDDDANGSGGQPQGGEIGDQCESNDDCATPICLFAGDAHYGFCSVPCESWSDCPSFWDCVDVQNATLKYCAPD